MVYIFFFLQTKPKKEELLVVKKSEMSILMTDIYETSLLLKKNIIANKKLGVFPKKVLKIHKAKLSKGKARDDFFIKQADIYLNSYKAVFKTTDQKVAFNEMVNNCITCHETKCPGPILRIKKLFIK